MPLNPKLYALLQDRFGKVRISNEGQRDTGCYVRDAITQKLKWNPSQRGEQYGVCCPFCGDTRLRLYFSYRWGVWDETEQEYNYNKVLCFNEDCLNKFEGNYDILREKVLGHRNRTSKMSVCEPQKTIKATATIPELPGPIVTLNQLDPNHPANVYIRQRGYDPNELAKLWSVGICEHPEKNFNVKTRIIIPVYMLNELKGWQARFIGERNWQMCQVPKYLFMPGFKKTECLYNYDEALIYDTVIVVEGVTDVWSVGPQAVALFGKKASKQQQWLLTQNWQNIVVMLDPDAKEESIELAKNLRTHGKKVANIMLPDGMDAGSMSRDYLWEIISEAQLK